MEATTLADRAPAGMASSADTGAAVIWATGSRVLLCPTVAARPEETSGGAGGGAAVATSSGGVSGTATPVAAEDGGVVVLVEQEKPRPRLAVRLARADEPYTRLCISQRGVASWQQKAGRFSLLAVLEDDIADAAGRRVVRLRSTALGEAKPSRTGTPGCYLGRERDASGWRWVGDAGGEEAAARFVVQAQAGEPPSRGLIDTPRDTEAAGVPVRPAGYANAEEGHAGALSQDQRVDFQRNGFVVVQRGVAGSLVGRALAVVNAALGTPGMVVSGGVEGNGKIGASVQSSPPLMNLLLSPHGGALPLAESLLGAGKVLNPRGSQIALRFPEVDEHGTPTRDPNVKLSGTEWHTDGMRQGRASPFTLLLGVALSATPSPMTGNLAVFPRSHDLLHKLLLPGGRLRGVDDKDGREFSVAVGGGDHNDPWCATATQLPDLGDPQQLLLRPGDVVLAHPKLAHRACPNLSPHVRYMIYFRLKHEAHDGSAMQAAMQEDLWAGMDGLQATPSAAAPVPRPVPRTSEVRCGRVLSAAQIAAFIRDGVVVVPGVLSAEQLDRARGGLGETLRKFHVDPSDLEATGGNLSRLSSTGGAGGVLDVFYPSWKLQLTLDHQRYHDTVADLFDATYARSDAGEGGLWSHPFGDFDPYQLLAHVDRIGFRVPDAVSSAHGSSTKRPLQRSLTPHLDCCPTAMHAGGGKAFPRWRPLQCMLSLTDSLEANTGGFECVRGFHHEFADYFSSDDGRDIPLDEEEAATRAVCVGDFCPIRPREDFTVISRYEHVPVPAGAAVIWDQRIPHANARYNRSDVPRSVVYGGWLPRVPCNEAYAEEQLRRFKLLLPQVDFWLEEGSAGAEHASGSATEDGVALLRELSEAALQKLGASRSDLE